MLESPALLLHPWLPAARAGLPQAPAGDVRLIDEAGGGRLGFARRAPRTTPAWLPWPSRLLIDVYETEDAAHLLTAERGWTPGGRWVVLDADRLPVGSFRLAARRSGVLALDQRDRRLAWIDLASGHVVGPDGGELGAVAAVGPAMRLAFAERLADDPLARMVLLAAVLSL